MIKQEFPSLPLVVELEYRREMRRLQQRLLNQFLWYAIVGHELQQRTQEKKEREP